MNFTFIAELTPNRKLQCQNAQLTKLTKLRKRCDTARDKPIVRTKVKKDIP